MKEEHFTFIIGMVEALIWPIILILFFRTYREKIGKKIEALTQAKFSVDGAEVFFKEMEEELENPQPKLEQGQITGRGISPQSRGTGKKSSPKPGLIDSKLPPYQQLFMINSKVEEYLRQMADYNNLSTDGFESLNMIDALTQKGVIDLTQRDKLVKITKLTRAANPTITKDQIDIVRKYYESI